MTQKQFESQFNEQDFRGFLLEMTEKQRAKADINSSDCFLGLYAQRAFAGRKIDINWRHIRLNDEEFLYPEWATNYLKYLRHLLDQDSEEFKEIARTESFRYLNSGHSWRTKPQY